MQMPMPIFQMPLNLHIGKQISLTLFERRNKLMFMELMKETTKSKTQRYTDLSSIFLTKNQKHSSSSRMRPRFLFVNEYFDNERNAKRGFVVEVSQYNQPLASSSATAGRGPRISIRVLKKVRIFQVKERVDLEDSMGLCNAYIKRFY